MKSLFTFFVGINSKNNNLLRISSWQKLFDVAIFMQVSDIL